METQHCSSPYDLLLKRILREHFSRCQISLSWTRSLLCIIHLSEKDLERCKCSLSSGPFRHSNEDSEFGWVSIQFQNHQQSTISLITVASACCLTYFAPAGQRLNVKLLDICHIKESWNVPGSFETAWNEITMTWQNESRWGSRGSCQCSSMRRIKSNVLQQIPPFSLFLSLRLTLPVYLCLAQTHNIVSSLSFVSLCLPC